MLSRNTNDIRRLLLGTILLLALVSCFPAPLEPADATATAPAGQSPSPSPEGPVAGTPAPQGKQPTPERSGTPAEMNAGVPEGILHLHPADVDNSLLPITPVEELHHTGQTQEYDIETYRLVVDGLVENQLSLSYDEVLSFPQVTETVLLICPGFFWDNTQWTGTPLRLILEEAGLAPEASAVRITGGGGYSQELPLEEAMADGVFLAYEVNGETLPPDHGYPLRLVVRHQFGSKWVKWVERIEVLP